MMKKKVVVIGAGGHAKVIVDILQQNNEYDIVGMVDKCQMPGFWGIPVIGTDSDLPQIFAEGIGHAFVAIGSNKIRQSVSKIVEKVGFQMINAISKHAIVSPYCKIGKGVAVMSGAVINGDTFLGDGCIVNTSASIDHDCTIESYVHVAPGTNVAGGVRIRSGSFIGVGSRIIDGIIIGCNVTVGAGTVVIHDIEENCTIVGSPARKIR